MLRSAIGCANSRRNLLPGTSLEFVDVLPERLPFPSLGLRQFGQSRFPTNSGEGVILLPILHLVMDFKPEIGAFVEQRAPDGQVGSQPGAGVGAEAWIFMRVQIGSVLALAATSLRRGPASRVASARADVGGGLAPGIHEFRVSGESLGGRGQSRVRLCC